MSPLESSKTNCFKPNPLGAGVDPMTHKPWTLGAVMPGCLNKIPRQRENKTASLVWEAGATLEKKMFLKASHLNWSTF